MQSHTDSFIHTAGLKVLEETSLARPKGFFQGIKRVALLNRSAIGDLILCLPALYKFRCLNPEVKLDLYCDQNNVQIAELLTIFDRVCPIPRLGNTYLSIIVSAFKARFKNYDVFVSMKVGFGRQGGLFALFLGANASTGFVPNVDDWEDSRSLVTDRAFTDPVKLTRSMYETQHYSVTIHQLFFENHLPEFMQELSDYNYPPTLVSHFKNQETIGNNYILLTVGSPRDPRKLTDQYLVKLIYMLSLDESVRIVLSGLREDLVRFNAFDLQLGERVLFAETPTISQLLGLVSMALVVCGGDGGTIHLSSLVHVPTVVIISSANESKWRPLAKMVRVFRYRELADEVDLGKLKHSIENLVMDRLSLLD